MFMLIFITSASILGAFNIISPQLMIDFNIGFSTVSLLAMVGVLVIGLASVIYSTLSDKISIRKLMLIGISMFNIGALLALVASYLNFYLFVIAVAIMVCGGTCGSGLMIVTATKYLSEEKHSKYYGYNTACVGVSQAVGILAGGFIATYISWRVLFALPFISLVTVPYIRKYIPDEKGSTTEKLDILGLGLFSLFTLFISLFFTISKTVILVLALVLLVAFFIYISKNQKAFINIEFFKNKKFVIINLLALVIFGLQSAFSFLFPFMAQGVYELTLDKVSLLLFPTFICAILVGANSGKIVEKLGSFKTLSLAIFCSIGSSLIAAICVDKGIVMISIAETLYAGSFALMYAPFMKLVTGTLQMNQVGVGIGFFNLMTGIGPSLLIAITGKMLSMSSLAKDLGLVAAKGALFSNILLIYAALLVVSILVLFVNKKLYKNNQKIGGKQNGNHCKNI
ncbi:MFS transporter [Clostridium perfringens]|nr:MFS transporter [Clostridium perfringens]